MTNQKLEEIFNRTFGGLTLFYRDTNLKEELISKYEPGKIIMERGFTDMSYKGGGMTTNLRYLIASAHAKDISALNPDAAVSGHVILHSNAYFKVLDNYSIGNKTQILLLEIPQDAISVFSGSIINIEDDIVKKGRSSFDTRINTLPVKELQTEEWIKRTEFPLGMDDNGELFYKGDSAQKREVTNVAVKPETPKAKNIETPGKPWWKLW